MHTNSLRKGFTLIELLLVIGIIAILASVVIIAINPSKHLREAEDSRRIRHIRELRVAIEQYVIDFPAGLAGITGTETPICAYDAASTATCVDLNILVDNDYITVYEQDVKETNPNHLGYSIYIDDRGFYIVRSLYITQ